MPLFDSDSESVSSDMSTSSRSSRSRRRRLAYTYRRPRRSNNEEYAENVRPNIIEAITRNDGEEGAPSTSRTERDMRDLLNSSAVSYEDLIDQARKDNYMMLFEPTPLPSEVEEVNICENYAPRDYCFACDAINQESYSKIREEIDQIVCTFHNHSMHSMPTYTIDAIYDKYETCLREEKNRLADKMIVTEMSKPNCDRNFINRLERTKIPEWKKSVIYKHYFTAEHSLQTEITIPFMIRKSLQQYSYFCDTMFVKHLDAPNKILHKSPLPDEARKYAKLIVGLYKDFFILRQMQTGETTFKQRIVGKKPGEIMSGQNADVPVPSAFSDSVLMQYFNNIQGM